MKKPLFLLWTVLFAFNYFGHCQSNNIYHLDENGILKNRNLDFFLSKLKTEHFTTLKNKQDIPEFIKEQLPWINDSSIANHDQEFQATDDVFDDKLPWRQLIFLCKSEDIFVVTYVKGGVGSNYKILFIKYADKKVLDVWLGTTFCQNLNSINEIIDCINENRKKEWGLNTNIVDK